MNDQPTPMLPDEEMLEQAGLPRFVSTFHDPEIGVLELRWEHGLTFYIDLSRRDIEPFDDHDRASILGLPYQCEDHEPIHVTVAGSAADPRTTTSIPGLEIHRVPALHPDDLTTLNGIPTTTPSRTLIDLAEVMSSDELRAAFARFRELGLLDPEALRAARARVEWRPSLEMLDEVIEEFCGA